MDLFDEVNKSKKDFPKANTVKNKVGSYKLNIYQMFSIGVFIICFLLGIVFGNLFSTCTTTSYFSSDTCVVTEFNYSIMFAIWFVSLLVCVFMFAIGHIIAILSQISEKLDKFK